MNASSNVNATALSPAERIEASGTTRTRPDDRNLTWSENTDRLTLIGLSSEASSLVGRLEGSKLWRAPALTGALQPDPRSRRDRFTLTADLAIVAPTVQNRQEQARGARAD